MPGILTFEKVNEYRSRLKKAQNYGDVWELVKDTVKDDLGKYRVGMMLFLDDLPLRLGAYHPVGTNNIIMNRSLVELVEAAAGKHISANAFVYSILLHEYLHALGIMREREVRSLVLKVSEDCFGSDHMITQLGREGPWSLLRGIPLDETQAPKRMMEIVRDFERSSQQYIA